MTSPMGVSTLLFVPCAKKDWHCTWHERDMVQFTHPQFSFFSVNLHKHCRFTSKYLPMVEKQNGRWLHCPFYTSIYDRNRVFVTGMVHSTDSEHLNWQNWIVEHNKFPLVHRKVQIISLICIRIHSARGRYSYVKGVQGCTTLQGRFLYAGKIRCFRMANFRDKIPKYGYPFRPKVTLEMGIRSVSGTPLSEPKSNYPTREFYEQLSNAPPSLNLSYQISIYVITCCKRQELFILRNFRKEVIGRFKSPFHQVELQRHVQAVVQVINAELYTYTSDSRNTHSCTNNNALASKQGWNFAPGKTKSLVKITKLKVEILCFRSSHNY